MTAGLRIAKQQKGKGRRERTGTASSLVKKLL